MILQLLRFAAIGALNTALDFVILNYVTKSFGITSGLELGVVNVLSFSCAIIQSYLWNRAWTFTLGSSSPLQNAYRLILVGGLGAAAFAAVLYGATFEAAPIYYLIVLAGFVLSEIVLWVAFRLSMATANQSTHTQFAVFIIVSLVGLLINSVVVVIASNFIAPYLQDVTNIDTIKNIAKALATVFSLIWNFLAYKLIVFKK